MSQPHVLLVGGTKMVERHLRKALPESATLRVMRTMEQAMRKMAEGPTDLLVLGPSMRRALAMVTTIRRDGDMSLGLIVVYRDDQRENVKRHLEGRHTADAYVMQSKVSREINDALVKAFSDEHAAMVTAIDELHEIEDLEELPMDSVSNVTEDVSLDARDVATVQMDVVAVGEVDTGLDEDATQVMEVIHGLNADSLAEVAEGDPKGEVLGAFDLDDEVLVEEIDEMEEIEEVEAIEDVEVIADAEVIEDADVIDDADLIEELEEIEAFEDGTDTDVLSDEAAAAPSAGDAFGRVDEITMQTELVEEGESDGLEELDAELLEELELVDDLEEDVPTNVLVEVLDDAVVALEEDGEELELAAADLIVDDGADEQVSDLDAELIEEAFLEVDLVEEDGIEEAIDAVDVVEEAPADAAGQPAAQEGPAAAEGLVEPESAAEAGNEALLADIDSRRARVRKQSSIEQISNNLTELSSLLGSMQQATTESARLEKENTTLLAEIEALQARLADQEGTVSADQLTAAQTACATAEAVADGLREELAAAQSELAAAGEQVADLRQQLQAATTAGADASANAAAVAGELRGLADRLTT